MASAQKNPEKNFFLRAGITFFCLVILVFFLYLPRLQEWLFQDNSLHIYAFPEMVSFEAISEFEQKYGIKISIKNFESNEELLTKFRITGGEGYDLITPSDYMVQLLQQDGLLHKLDHAKLPVINELAPHLLNKYYDPGNHYSLPMSWATYGIVFKKSIFNIIPESLSLNFLFEDPAFSSYDVKSPYKICMVDDFIESIFLTSLYLFGDVNYFDDARLQAIKLKLIEQKKWVEAYLYQDIRQFLFSDVFHVAMTSSMNMKRMLQENDDFGFKIPREGSLLIIENYAIPARCKKVEMVYTLINFLLSKRICSFNSQLYGYNPVNKLAYADQEKRFLYNPNFFPDEETLSRLHVLHNNFPLKKFEEVWLEVKSA